MSRIVFILSFFSYGGYYVGLGILFALNLSHLSRLYSLPLRVLLMLLSIVLINKYASGLKKKETWVLFMVFAFWIFYFFKVLLTQNEILSGEIMRPWAEYIFYGATYSLIPFIAFYLIDFQKYKDEILNGFILSGFLLGVVALYAYGGALTSGVSRVSHLSYETGQETLSPLALSYTGSMTIALVLHKLIFYKKSKLQFIYLVTSLVLGFVMFLLGASRGSVIALILSLLLFFLYSKGSKKFILIISMFILVPAFLWAIEASGSGILDRMQNTGSDGGGGRSFIWAETFNHFAENMLLGGRIEIGGLYPHNFVLEVLMSTGLVGAFLLFPLIFYTIYTSRKLQSKDIFIMLIFVQGLSLHMFSGSITSATILFVPMALVIGINRSKRTSIEQKK